MKPNTLYYLSAIPMAIGAFMCLKAGQMEERQRQQSEVWDDATSAGEGSVRNGGGIIRGHGRRSGDAEVARPADTARLGGKRWR